MSKAKQLLEHVNSLTVEEAEALATEAYDDYVACEDVHKHAVKSYEVQLFASVWRFCADMAFHKE